MERKAKILVIDDERHTREGLKRALKADYDVLLADNGQTGMDMIFERGVDLVLTDLKMPGLNGMELLKRVAAMEHPPVCIMLTAYGSIDTAIEAVRAGAESFLEKPVDLDKLEITIKQALENRTLKVENRELKRELASKYAFENIIGESPAIMSVYDTVKQVAPARSTVLLTGENGTGKEIFARATHQLSNRSDKPFVAIHCAALNTTLLESELFGHERGAFSGAVEQRVGRFEAADGGTLFLDEIGEIDPAVQVKLLRVLETRTFERVGGSEPMTVDVRLIAATNRDLGTMVQDGDFREDLYYRLNVLNVHVPALRHRREDIPLLMMHYLRMFNSENGKDVLGFTQDVIKMLEAFDWPGNVRQLKNCVERMVVLARTDKITLKDVPDEIRVAVENGPTLKVETRGGSLDMESNEKFLIQRALEECGGNRTAAAEKLGISRRTLHRKLKTFDLE
jgi:two-component system response regulator AtoC